MKVIGTAEATAVIADYFDLICDTDYAFDESEILRRLNANAIDAELVRHGKWILGNGFKCSLCGRWIDVLQGTAAMNYCPHCGVRMNK